MKRHLLAIYVGSLFALPALANNEIDAGNLPANVTPSLTQAQVRAELIAAQRAGDVIVNAELGTTGRTVRHAGRTRDEVVAELIAAQQAGTVLLEARSGDRATAQGTLSVIDSRIDQNTGTVRLKGTFANDPLTLWPGQFVNIRLHLKTLNGAVAVPIAALQQGATDRFVYRVAPDDTVRQTPVEVGYEDENRAVILSGLDAGSTVAMTGFNNLKDGTKISIDTGQGGNAAPKAPVSSKGEDAPVDERKSESENGQPLKAAQRDTRG
jgi:multidrug efflux pump subunit AcrA (membrane-fusion protein)